ncbi:MAG TPA: site-specific integrase [Acidimicrobiales bacterium]|nr:site-specific integrase [Acidimicrobiales bacterium]
MASIDRRPNGKWRARWREYPGGPQKAKHFARKVDAERFLVDVQHRLFAGTYVALEESRVTLDAFAEVYLARQPWRPSTAVLAANALAHARRVLGARPLGSIRKGDVQAFVTGLDLAPATVATAFQQLNTLMAAAVEDGLLARNPARGVKLPAGRSGEIVPPSREQVAAIYEAAAPWFRPAVILGAGLGLRQGEASGLSVDRIDWLGRTVRVDRQWMSRHGRSEFGPPKSTASSRTIPASGFVLDELAAHVGRRQHGFVLHRDGAPVNYNDACYWWRKATKAAGVKGLRFHDLRHAYASALVSAGCSVKAVQHALGHASAATTLNLYSHMWSGDDDRIRQAVDGAFLRSTEDSLRTAAPDA